KPVVQPLAVAPVAAAPVAAPTLAPLPTAVPTPSRAALDFVAGIRGDLTARWLKNHTETALRSGPNQASPFFTVLPQWSTLRLLQTQGDWLFVQYGGDGDTRQAGPGWVKASDVGAVGPPTVWLSTSRTTVLWGGADGSAGRSLDLPGAALME